MPPPSDFCVCESCRERLPLVLFRTPTPVVTAVHTHKRGWVEHECYAIALCIPCGIRSGLPRFFDAPAVAVARAVSA